MCTSFKAEILTNHTHTENNETSVSTKLFKRRSVPAVTKKSFWDWSQCLIGINPNWTLGSIPMSNWDWSQLDIGINPNGINPNVQLGSIPIGHWDQSQCPIGINPNWTLGLGSMTCFFQDTLTTKWEEETLLASELI